MCVRRTTWLGTPLRVSAPRPGSLLLPCCWGSLLRVLLLKGSGVRATDHVAWYAAACVCSTSWLLAALLLGVAAAGAAAKGAGCACDGPRGLVRRCVCLLHVLAPCCCLAALGAAANCFVFSFSDLSFKLSFPLDLRQVQSNKAMEGVQIQIESAETVELRARERQNVKDDVDHSSSSDENCRKGMCSDSDMESLDSTQESEAANGLEEENLHEDSDNEAPMAEDIAQPELKRAAGTHVVRRDLYFTLVDYSQVGAGRDAKILILPRFCTAPPAGMGVTQKSKTFTILDHDDSRANPWRTYLLLRSWALWRAKQHGFVAHLPARQRWYDLEVASMREELKRNGSASSALLSTGNAQADAKIRQWAPEILQP